MKYFDDLYGNWIINEPVILELISLPELERLKYIDQAGYRSLWVNPTAHIKNIQNSRFAHSIGVYLLLKKYGADVSEQIAGLIHDVSHSAFSHSIDYILDEGTQKKQSHQDSIFDNYVRDSQIPLVLQKHGFDWNYIVDDSHFPLKEKNLPDVCADRIDYILRTARLFEGLTDQKIQYYFLHLKVGDGMWYFDDVISAKDFSEMFLYLNKKYLSSFKAAHMFAAIGEYFRYALQLGYIEYKDLYTTDGEVLEKVRFHHIHDSQLQRLYDRLEGKIGASHDPKNYDRHVFCKSRVIDPYCLKDKSMKQLSYFVPKWRDVVLQESRPKEYFVKFEK